MWFILIYFLLYRVIILGSFGIERKFREELLLEIFMLSLSEVFQHKMCFLTYVMILR